MFGLVASIFFLSLEIGGIFSRSSTFITYLCERGTPLGPRLVDYHLAIFEIRQYRDKIRLLQVDLLFKILYLTGEKGVWN
jgi:hypothetical protein